jgi:hypothetical protein
MRVLPTVLALAGVGAAVVLAPVAVAAPNCTNTGPTTTQCETPGHSQIITSPPANNYSPWYGWPYGGGIVLDLGRR